MSIENPTLQTTLRDMRLLVLADWTETTIDEMIEYGYEFERAEGIKHVECDFETFAYINLILISREIAGVEMHYLYVYRHFEDKDEYIVRVHQIRGEEKVHA